MPLAAIHQVVNLASTARQAVDYFFATATLALGGLVVTTLILPRLV